MAQSAEAVEYTDCTFADGYDSPTTSVLDMTLKNMMVRLQSWSLGLQSIPLLPSLPGLLWSEVVAPDRVLSKLNCLK